LVIVVDHTNISLVQEIKVKRIKNKKSLLKEQWKQLGNTNREEEGETQI
jgi:hypothetical protein